MYSFPAELSADADEQLNNSSLSQSIWNSSDPQFTTSSGVYDNNNLNGYDNAPTNYEQHDPPYHSESESKEGCSLEDFDVNKKHALLDLCAGFMTHSLRDDERNSDKDINRDKDIISIEYIKSDDDISDDKDCISEGDASSDEESTSSDSDDDNGTALKRHGHFMDLHQLYDYPQSVSSPRRRNFVVRGIDAHSSSDIKFCRKVWDGRDKLCISDTTPKSTEVKEAISKDTSNGEDDAASDAKSFMDMILSSEEYLYIQDNIENLQLYRDHVYKQSLKKNPRRKKAVLLDVLPTLVEESATTEDDMMDENSGGDTNKTTSLVSHNESDPVIKKMKRKKRRFESVRNWFSKTFCGCWKSKEPP